MNEQSGAYSPRGREEGKGGYAGGTVNMCVAAVAAVAADRRRRKTAQTANATAAVNDV